ncbi:ABC transporter permease [Jatrophihabitans sp.]|uniref:ABC transporter permease n=1 Tax=Jatrophihabitans sp. TaxID=1932789 RepID=UPI002BD48E2F|nr:hypothetical protein [Jatrophihabitans sp.]
MTALLSGFLTVLTLVTRDWLEVTGFDPDRHSGAVEWGLVAILGAISLVSGAVAGTRWRRAIAST